MIKDLRSNTADLNNLLNSSKFYIVLLLNDANHYEEISLSSFYGYSTEGRLLTSAPRPEGINTSSEYTLTNG